MRTGIEVEEARRWVLEGAVALPAEVVTTADALGRVLAAPVASTRTLPPADCSAMDGYALRADDLAGATRATPAPARGRLRGAGGRQRAPAPAPG